MDTGTHRRRVKDVCTIVAMSLVAGWLLYKVVETPFMALRDRYVPTNSPARVLTPQPQ
jgi:peptidoglycan/LPS O-acetylase OafA/YrhL